MASSAFVWLAQTRIQCWHGDRQRLRTIWSRWASPARQVPMEDSHGRSAESSAQVVNQGHSAAALDREKRFDNHHVATGHCEQWIDETKDLAQMRGMGGHANANDDLAALARTCAHLADSRAHRTAATGTTPISPPAELSVCFSHNIITRPHHASTTHATFTHSPRHTSLCPVISSPCHDDERIGTVAITAVAAATMAEIAVAAVGTAAPTVQCLPRPATRETWFVPGTSRMTSAHARALSPRGLYTARLTGLGSKCGLSTMVWPRVVYKDAAAATVQSGPRASNDALSCAHDFTLGRRQRGQ